jgi:hypothetical protein
VWSVKGGGGDSVDILEPVCMYTGTVRYPCNVQRPGFQEIKLESRFICQDGAA